jgi:hypothetical protein
MLYLFVFGVAVVTTLATIFLIENKIIIKTVPRRIPIENKNNAKFNDNYLSFILMLTNIINSKFKYNKDQYSLHIDDIIALTSLKTDKNIDLALHKLYIYVKINGINSYVQKIIDICPHDKKILIEEKLKMNINANDYNKDKKYENEDEYEYEYDEDKKDKDENEDKDENQNENKKGDEMNTLFSDIMSASKNGQLENNLMKYLASPSNINKISNFFVPSNK